MLKTLGSVKLAIVLLSLIVIASIIGTLIPQNLSERAYSQKYGDGRYNLLKSLQLTDVYHSAWYSLLLFAFCVNLCLCSIQNIGVLVRSLTLSSSKAGRVEVKELPAYEAIQLGTDAAGIEQISRRMKSILARRFYRNKFTDEERGIFYFERGKIGRLGPLITHASIIIILIGGIFISMLGFKDYREIHVGETTDVPHADFQLRVEDFKVEFYPETRSPKEFTSTVTVIEDGRDIFTKSIEVNHPLRHRGINFYQSNYGLVGGSAMGDIIEVELSRKSEVLGRFKLDSREVFQIPDSQLEIKVLALVPDFFMDATGNIRSRSARANNPAALMELYEGEESIYKSWSFLKFPDFHGSGKSDYSLKLISVSTDSGSAKYYTGLQITSAPGLSVIWGGCLLMVAGMFLSFYVPFKRIWLRVSDDLIEIGGRSYRNRGSFDREFSRLKDALD